MKIQEFSRDHASKSLDKWRKYNELPELSPEYTIMRTVLLQLFEEAQNESMNNDRKEYITDVLFGIKLYDYLGKQSWFNLRTAANDAFWRYISVAVIPDIVTSRWGADKDNYFWKQSNRLWPKTIWWYIHLTWHESLETTKNMLISKHFNSDTIQGIVERTGKRGTFVEVYREIIYQYSKLDYMTIVKFKKQLTSGSDSLFRAVMRLNTARGLVEDPCLCIGGVEGYVGSLYKDLIKNL